MIGNGDYAGQWGRMPHPVNPKPAERAPAPTKGTGREPPYSTNESRVDTIAEPENTLAPQWATATSDMVPRESVKTLNPAHTDAAMYSYLVEAMDEWGCKHDHPEINREVAVIMRELMSAKEEGR